MLSGIPGSGGGGGAERSKEALRQLVSVNATSAGQKLVKSAGTLVAVLAVGFFSGKAAEHPLQNR